MLNLGFLGKKVKLKQILIYSYIIASIAGSQLAYADDEEVVNSHNLNIDYSNNQISLTQKPAHIDAPVITGDWIKTQSIVDETNTPKFNYSITAIKDFTIGNEISFAWNLNDFFSVSLNVYENQLLSDFDTENNSTYSNYQNFNKIATTANQSSELDINRGISGYTFGIASELGLGNDFKLDLNLDYGQLDGADLMGFNNNEITTTSFGVGIRKSKFGASVNTDLYLEENIDFRDNSRLGIEFDWYFTDKTTISLGTKQRINNTPTNTSSSLDNLTGNVQYIKFQHNL